jgi:hypothetical protein
MRQNYIHYNNSHTKTKNCNDRMFATTRNTLHQQQQPESTKPFSFDEEAQKLRQIESYRRKKIENNSVSEPQQPFYSYPFTSHEQQSTTTPPFVFQQPPPYPPQQQISEFKGLYPYSNLFSNPLHYDSSNNNNMDEQVTESVSDNNSNDNNNNEIILLNTRINALQEIIHIQEQEIQKSKTDSDYKNNLQSSMIAKYREKVYSMLIQIKSMDISSNNENKEHRMEQKQLAEKMKNLEYELSVAKQRETDLNANMEILKTGKRFADVTIKKMEMRQHLHVQEVNEHKSSEAIVADMISRFCGGIWKQTDVLQGQLLKLESMNNRVRFASNRVSAIRSILSTQYKTDQKQQQIQHQQQMLKHQQQQIRPDQQQYIIQQDLITTLHREVERLTQDRDALLQINERHQQELAHAVEQVTQKLEAEKEQVIIHANSAAEELFICNEHLNMKNQECDELRKALQRAQIALTEELDGIRQMKQQFVHIQEQNRMKRDQAIRRIVNESDERYAQLLEEHNTLKSEFAKLTASAAGLERELKHERQEKVNADKYDYYEQKLKAKDIEIERIRAENQMLLSSLRQHEQKGIPSNIYPLGTEFSKAEINYPLRSASNINKPASDRTAIASPQQEIPEREEMLSVLDNLSTLTSKLMNQNEFK